MTRGRVNLRGGEFAWKANRRVSAGVRVVRPPFILMVYLLLWKASVYGLHGSPAKRCALHGVVFESSAFRFLLLGDDHDEEATWGLHQDRPCASQTRLQGASADETRRMLRQIKAVKRE